MLPNAWKQVPFGSLISGLKAGVSVNGEDRVAGPGEFGVLKISAVTSGTFDPAHNKAIRSDELARAATSPAANRIVISRSNTEALVGASAYVEHACPTLFLSDKLWQVEPAAKNPPNMRWLSYWLASEKTRQALSRLATGTSGSMKNISKEQLCALLVPLSPKWEQDRIALLLNTWDCAIVTSERLLSNSRKQKQALMQCLFSSRNHKHQASEIFFSNSVRRNDGLELLSVMQDVGVVPRRLLDRKVVMPDGSTEAYKLVEPGDFVISLRSFEGGLEYSRYTGLVSPAYTVLKPRIPICDDYYRHFFKSWQFIGRLAVAVIGIRDGKQISYEDFSFLKLPYPELEEQKRIAAILNQAEAMIEGHRQHLEKMQAEKYALIAQLLTGKRRVRMPASATEAAA